jgi:hypothetical protein
MAVPQSTQTAQNGAIWRTAGLRRASPPAPWRGRWAQEAAGRCQAEGREQRSVADWGSCRWVESRSPVLRWVENSSSPPLPPPQVALRSKNKPPPKAHARAAPDRPALQALVVRRRRYLAHLYPPCAAFQVGFSTAGQHTGHFGALGSPALEFGQRRLCYGMCALETWARGWSSSVHGSDANK